MHDAETESGLHPYAEMSCHAGCQPGIAITIHHLCEVIIDHYCPLTTYTSSPSHDQIGVNQSIVSFELPCDSGSAIFAAL